MNTDILQNSYFSFLHSYLMYWVLLSGNATESNRPFLRQKQAIRISSNNGFWDYCHLFFKNLNMLTLSNMFTLQSLMEIYNTKSQLETNASFITTIHEMHKI